MTIPTVNSLRRSHRRPDRHQLGVGHVLDAMKRGSALRLEYQNGRSLWSLSRGPFVAADIAATRHHQTLRRPCGPRAFSRAARADLEIFQDQEKQND